jgi:hypothetical protein
MPWALNPGPVVAPNVDTLYGAALLDLNNPQALQVADNYLNYISNGDRYYSVTFLDLYMNEIAHINNVDHPHGGLFCLGENATATATCVAILAHQHKTATGLNLNFRFGIMLVRVWSNGAPSTVPCRGGPYAALVPAFPAGYTGPQDVDGCAFFMNTGLQQVGGSAAATPYAEWRPFFAPNSPFQPPKYPALPAHTCVYHFGEQPCGKSATSDQQNRFWDAVCQVIADAPPNAGEATYIDTQFSSLGIHSTGCGALNYAVLNAGIATGYAAVNSVQGFTGVLGHQHPNEWIYLPFDGTWAGNSASMLERAVASHRLHWLVANSESAYWAAYNDSRPPAQRTRLDCSGGNVYRVKFDDTQVVPVDYAAKGFWSVTIYNSEWFLVHTANNVGYGVRGHDPIIPQPFYISANCTDLKKSPCYNAPAGEFQLLFRGYRPLSGLFLEGDYELPKVQLCKGSKGLGC